MEIRRSVMRIRRIPTKMIHKRLRRKNRSILGVSPIGLGLDGLGGKVRRIREVWIYVAAPEDVRRGKGLNRKGGKTQRLEAVHESSKALLHQWDVEIYKEAETFVSQLKIADDLSFMDRKYSFYRFQFNDYFVFHQ